MDMLSSLLELLAPATLGKACVESKGRLHVCPRRHACERWYGWHWVLGVKGTTVNALPHEAGTHLGLPSLLCKVA